MSFGGRSFGVHFGRQSEGPVGSEITRWYLGEPELKGHSGSLATAKFDCLTPSTLDVADECAWMFLSLGGRRIDERRLRIVRTWDGDFGTRSLLFEGDEVDLWRQLYLMRMLADSPRLSPSFLRTDAQRWGWIRATVAYSAVTTPWIWGGAVGPSFALTQPIPTRLQVTVEPNMFVSSSVFFSQIGERLLGPAGYVGQDFHGFAEIMRRLAHITERIDVCLVDPELCAETASSWNGSSSLFTEVREILGATSIVAVQ